MTRTKTGIPGFDDLIDGGLVEGSATLLSGRSGSGKTVFGLQFLYHGADKNNEPGILVTLESRPKELRTEAAQFGWDLEFLEADNKLIIIDAASNKAGLPTSARYALRRGFDTTTLAEEIYRATDEIKAKRVVVDCLSGLSVRFSEKSEVRNAVYRISALLRELNVTSILIGETNNATDHSRAGVEQFLTQGLIMLNLSESKTGLERSILVWKMRQTQHSLKRHPFVIDKKGIRIKRPTSKAK